MGNSNKKEDLRLSDGQCDLVDCAFTVNTNPCMTELKFCNECKKHICEDHQKTHYDYIKCVYRDCKNISDHALFGSEKINRYCYIHAALSTDRETPYSEIVMRSYKADMAFRKIDQRTV